MVVRDGADFVTHQGLHVEGGAVLFESAGGVTREIFVNGGALNIDNSFVSTTKLDVFGGSVLLSGHAGLTVVAPQPLVVPGGEGSARIAGGVLTIDGDFVQRDGNLVLEIGGTAVGTEHDQLRVSGNFSIEGGVLELRFIGGFAPTTGDRYTLLNVGGSLLNTGSFTVSGLLPGWQYSTAFDVSSHSFTLTSINDGVSAVPEPGNWALLLGGAALLRWRWNRRSQGQAPAGQ
jgi:hypothetical protein